MKRLATFFALTLVCLYASAQDWPNLGRFADADAALAARPAGSRVVFMGNSITDNWIKYHHEFFDSYGFIARGISGQTTPQMLIRFRRDVVEAGASTVVILAGTNDIAGNTGPSTPEMILDNIKGMCDIARAAGVRVVLCSILPAHKYYWKGGMDKHPQTVIPLYNAMLKAYAESEKITYVDFFTPMVDSDPDNLNGLPKKYSKDGIHPTIEGYAVMEEVLLKALSKEVKLAEKAKKGRSLTLMSYNVRNCKGMDLKRHYDRVAAVISDFHPDVVAVQELDSLTARSEKHYVLRDLAYRTGLYATYSAAIDFDGGKYGVGMLSAEEPLRTARVALPGREERRTLLMAEFSNYIYCCTHLSLTKEDRAASVGIINNALSEFVKGAACGKPVYIAGDWNDEPNSEFMSKMTQYFELLTDTSAPTFPSDRPDSTIDYIARWKGNTLSVGSGKVVETFVPCASMASDHRPVVVVL